MNKFQTKYAKLLEQVELDCDPNGQSPIEMAWIQRPLAAQSGAVNQSLSKHYPQRDSNNSDRRLFVGQLRTDLSDRNLDPKSSLDLQQMLDNQHIAQQQLPISSPDNLMAFEIHRRASSANAEDPKSELGRLIIKQARRSHSSDFICRATNKYGTDEKTIRLLILEAPDAVQEINVIRLESRSASITWSPPYNGNSPITGYLVEWALVSANGQTSKSTPIKWSQVTVQQPMATIGPLLPLNSYEVRVRAQNQFGQSPLATLTPTGFALIKTQEEPPSSPPSDVRAVAISSSSVQISWLPPIPGPSTNEDTTIARFTVKGYYLGYRIALSNESYVYKTVSLTEGSTKTGHLMATTEIQPRSNSSSVETRDILNSTASLGDGQAPRTKVVISDLQRSTKYTIIVQAFNSVGTGPQSDAIDVKTLIDDPPPAPQVRIGLITYTSIELQWSFIAPQHELGAMISKNEKAPTTPLIDGYLLYYKRSSVNYETESGWSERRLTADTHALMPSVSTGRLTEYSLVERHSIVANDNTMSKDDLIGSLHHNASLAHKSFRFILDQLNCGSAYQLYLVGYNSIGTGQPSSILRTKTRGSAPIAPRRQDFFMQINSSLILVNLDSWMDGGCSIMNFEIKYRQTSDTSSNVTSGEQKSAVTDPQQPVDSNSWTVVSSNVSPEQQNLEIRDLKPETWYTIYIKAESAAGKTEALYTFMTLDKYGQVPLRALESAPSNMPSLFRTSNGSVMIRSILTNFGLNAHHLSPMLMSSCLCFVLLVTCTVVLLRRHHSSSSSININHRDMDTSDDGKHNISSLDSLGCRRSIDHYGSQYHPDHLHMQLQSSATLNKQAIPSSPQIMQHEHCTGGNLSPCKTTTTMVTNSTSSNGSSAASQNNQDFYGPPESSAKMSSLSDVGHSTCFASRNRSSMPDTDCHHNDDRCLSQRIQSCESPSKLATLGRDFTMPEKSANRFRTLPHNAFHERPISTFLTHINNFQDPENQQQTHIIYPQHHLQHNHQQEVIHCGPTSDIQPQLYSKLKFMCDNSNSHYNLCQEAHLAGELQQPSKLQHQQFQNICNQSPPFSSTTLNHQSKLVVDTPSCQLKRSHNNQAYLMQPDAFLAIDQRTVPLEPIEHHDCQPHEIADDHEDHRQLDYACGAANNHLSMYLDQQQNPQQQAAIYGTFGGVGSIASSSTTTYNTNSSSQQTASSSKLNCQSANGTGEQQLIDLANGNQNNPNQAQCPSHVKLGPKVFHNGNCHTGLGSPSNGLQSQPNTTAPLNQPTNEQSDYALPFPPKWV